MTFDPETSTGKSAADGPAARLGLLRAELSRRGLDGFIVPLFDEFQGEYIPLYRQRLKWLTGFSGSAGSAVVMADKAALFVDSRYTVQARGQVGTELYDHRNVSKTTVAKWLGANVGGGNRIGYDPWLHTPDAVKEFRKAVEDAGAELVGVEDNPVDAVRPDIPPPPLTPMIIHDMVYCGQSANHKRNALAAELKEAGIDAAVITAPDSIAWLLNVRGDDLPCTPVSLSFALLKADASVDLFIDRRKVGEEVLVHLGNEVGLFQMEEFGGALDDLGKAGKTIRADPKATVSWIFDRLGESGARIAEGDDPCLLPKACKNDVELACIRKAHVRDGAALTRFLCWLASSAQDGSVDEVTAAAKLEEFRRGNPELRDLSFPTISASGRNGALPHYNGSANRPLAPGGIYLVDSGGQYLDGTTDVTRTVAIGKPSPEHRDRFTRVLKGHIAISTARFPEGTTGAQLDTLARTALWQAGIDFGHGVGHGVGIYLRVHEGPQSVSVRGTGVPLKPGMVVSNEPGYYKEGEYGIRIENLIEIREAEAVDGQEGTYLTSRPLTLAPIDLTLVEPSLLTDDERGWLNDYHLWVRETLTPIVDGDTSLWLKQATREI